MPKAPFFKDSGHCPKILDYTLFLNKCFLLQSKHFFKVKFARETKLILPKCANIMRTSRKNVLTMLFSQDEKDTC